VNVAEGRKYFRDFLRTEFSEENVLFWLACEELKRETNAELIEEKARSIYEDYISILSPKEVRVSSILYSFHCRPVRTLGSRVVSVLDSGAEGPGFKSQSRHCRVTVLGKLFTPIVPLFTKQRNW